LFLVFVFSLFFQEIEMNKASWSTLFEPYQFFEAYKNYLQVEVVAADAEDHRLWKGWVESRLRQLTLKVLYSLPNIMQLNVLRIFILHYCTQECGV
jgi:poly(A) polymerase Pap1